MKPLFILALFVALHPVTFSQFFKNGGLEGIVTDKSQLAPGWFAVDKDDPVCLTDVTGNDTPDLVSTYPTSSPAYGTYYGLRGNPHSGKTFMTGLHMTHPLSAYHEGIQQEVGYFKVDSTYTISFYQANVKQLNGLDTSGSWAVYMDTTLIGITAPSISHLPPNSFQLNWEYREVTFTATATAHVIKFMPLDDDPNYGDYSLDGTLRMGIDDISITNLNPVLVIGNIFTPNNDGYNDTFIPISSGKVQSMTTIITNRWGNLVYETTDLEINWDGTTKNNEKAPDGVYFWKVFGIDSNSAPFSKDGVLHLIR